MRVVVLRWPVACGEHLFPSYTRRTVNDRRQRDKGGVDYRWAHRIWSDFYCRLDFSTVGENGVFSCTNEVCHGAIIVLLSPSIKWSVYYNAQMYFHHWYLIPEDNFIEMDTAISESLRQTYRLIAIVLSPVILFVVSEFILTLSQC